MAAADSNKKSFNVGAYLESKGYEYARTGDDGKYYVTTPEGDERPFDVKGFLKSKGMDGISYSFNTADDAEDNSPVTIPDRVKLALGNTRGNLNYLKNKFEDAKYSADKGLVVKDNGVWKTVDKSSTDPYELAADVMEGAVAMAPSLIGGTAGAAAGALIPIPGSSVIGAAGGAAVVQKIRGTLGRLAGTYDATPEEELKDIGWEALLNAGGQALALGAKPVLGKIVDAAKHISKTAPSATKNVMADVTGRLTGAGPEATTTLFEQPSQVGKLISRGLQKYGGENAAIEGHKVESIKLVERMVERAPNALSQKFGSLVDDLAEAAPPNFKMNIGGIIKEAQKDLEAKGMGKLEENGLFRLLTNKEGINKMIAGEKGNLIDPETRNAVGHMVDLLNEVGSAGTANGKNAVMAAMDLKRNLNQISRNLTSGNQAPTLKAFVDNVRQSVTQRIGEKFEAAGMSKQYQATAAVYEKFADSVALARRIQQQERGPEMLLNRLVSGLGRNQTHKDLAADMAQLLGTKGEAMLKGIELRDAASKFTRALPKVTLSSMGAGGVATAAAHGGLLSPATAALAATQASPRLVAKEVELASRALPYLKTSAEFIRNMTPAVRTQWLKSPEAIDATFRTAFGAMMSEDENVNQLMNSGGQQ